MSELIVTIRCITYNHEAFIRECLEGFVMQQTNFRFEAIVHDDASTDGTAAIIAEYAAKYPEIIKPLYETENQYSKRDGSLKRIMDAHMHGKYIAICEGDDYWTDPHKLQKQVDFLEANPDFSMCFHGVEVIADNGMATGIYDHQENRKYTGGEILRRWTVPTCSVLYRREILPLIPKNKNLQYGDNVLFATCARHGKLMCMTEKMGAYRRLDSGAVAQFNPRLMLMHYVGLIECFPEYYDGIAPEIFKFAPSVIKDDMKSMHLCRMTKYFIIIGNAIGFCRIIIELLSWTFLHKSYYRK